MLQLKPGIIPGFSFLRSYTRKKRFSLFADHSRELIPGFPILIIYSEFLLIFFSFCIDYQCTLIYYDNDNVH